MQRQTFLPKQSLSKCLLRIKHKLRPYQIHGQRKFSTCIKTQSFRRLLISKVLRILHAEHSQSRLMTLVSRVPILASPNQAHSFNYRTWEHRMNYLSSLLALWRFLSQWNSKFKPVCWPCLLYREATLTRLVVWYPLVYLRWRTKSMGFVGILQPSGVSVGVN